MNDKDLNELKKDFDSIEVPIEIDMTIEKAIRKAKKDNIKWKRVMPSVAAAFLICSSILAYRSQFLNNKYVSKSDSYSDLIYADKVEYDLKGLPVLGSYDNLIKLLGYSSNYGTGENKDVSYDSAAQDKTNRLGSSQNDGKTKESVISQGSLKNIDYSSTNVQVDGIDEADEVKTDGEYIYKVNKDSLYIIKAFPKEELNIVKTIKLKENTGGAQLFLNGDKLVVIAYYYSNIPYDDVISKSASDSKMMPGYNRSQYTKLTVYDVSDKNNIKTLREVEVEGSLNSARMIDSTIYMIGSKGIYYYGAINGSKLDESIILPKYKDEKFNKGYTVIPFDKISYCPEAISPNFIIVSSINLKKLDESIKVTSCVGSAQNLYMSEKNLYVSGTGYSADTQKRIQQGFGEKTTIYRFSLNNGTVKYETSGEVSGYLINQFSMDESEGYFRVATTKNNFNENMSGISNGIYVLDKDMKVFGKLENLAKGERIYSTRFMGNRLFMVTFRNTDPLFVIDLADPRSPRVLGELKIPGFSNYLHPYDENHIIGFGMNTEAQVIEGREIVKQKGMKVALFDVSDVNKPKQKFETLIGDSGTYSELLYNHKALLFSKSKGLLAFPVDVMEKGSEKNAYPTPSFQGLYVYNVDLSTGFSLRGRITHISGEATGKDAYEKYANTYLSRVERAVYINDVLYTFSQRYLKANSLNSLEELKTLKFQ